MLFCGFPIWFPVSLLLFSCLQIGAYLHWGGYDAWIWSSWVMIWSSWVMIWIGVCCVDVNRSFDLEVVDATWHGILEDPWNWSPEYLAHIASLQINQRTWWYISISHRGFYGNFMIHILIKRWTHWLGLIRFTRAVSPSPAKNRVLVEKTCH